MDGLPYFNFIATHSDMNSAVRYLSAFAVASMASFVGLREAFDGIFDASWVPFLVSAIVGAVSVLICGLLGNILRDPQIARDWFASVFPALGTLVSGLCLFVLGVVSTHPTAVSVPHTDPVQYSYRLNWAYWPGYFLVIFAVTHFPFGRLRHQALSAT